VGAYCIVSDTVVNTDVLTGLSTCQ